MCNGFIKACTFLLFHSDATVASPVMSAGCGVHGGPWGSVSGRGHGRGLGSTVLPLSGVSQLHTCASSQGCLCNFDHCLWPFPRRSLAIKEFFSKPKYNHILKPEDCLAEPCTILQLDMRTVQICDLEVRREAACSGPCSAGCAEGIFQPSATSFPFYSCCSVIAIHISASFSL